MFGILTIKNVLKIDHFKTIDSFIMKMIVLLTLFFFMFYVSKMFSKMYSTDGLIFNKRFNYNIIVLVPPDEL